MSWCTPSRRPASLGHSDIETEHLLLGLLPEENGPGAQIPRDFDGEADPKLRNAVIRALSGAAPA
jgi:ClpA/ClpB-like protein